MEPPPPRGEAPSNVDLVMSVSVFTLNPKAVTHSRSQLPSFPGSSLTDESLSNFAFTGRALHPFSVAPATPKLVTMGFDPGRKPRDCRAQAPSLTAAAVLLMTSCMHVQVAQVEQARVVGGDAHCPS